MDFSKIGGAAIGCMCIAIYCIMVSTTYVKIGEGDDIDGFQYVPYGIALSGLLIGVLAGLYTYAQLNTTYVFLVSIGISCLALGILYGAFCLTAITH